ncbi:MAG: DUF4105 domain-containing protein [Gammaproteobacteria bacterium]|nr:DUF4105 domain-containing protein [Gammaproteobacteria bacterium]
MNIYNWLLATILLFFQSVVLAVHNNLDHLTAQAKAMELAQDPAWLNLLHYKQHVFAGVYSQADDAAFFLSAQGKHDPRAELHASLQQLVNADGRKQFVCRFPARYHWLNAKLNFQPETSDSNCAEFETWQQKLNAEQITLLFPAMYLNNPASMFGHTFLRLDQPQRSPLLSYTLSYAAATDVNDNPLVYVYKGLFGGYLGVFNIQPYYTTLQKYSDIEQRDIWEYALNLTQQEIDQLVRHLWEVRGISFDYYFLRENCSYRLLSLLDVARPGLEMTLQSHPLYAIPVDTVRTIAAAGLIASKHYRPSRNSRIEQMYRQLAPPLQLKALQLADDPDSSVDNFTRNQQAQMLELAQEIVQLEPTENDQKNHRLLMARSRLALAVEQKTDFQFNNISPESGHLSARWHIGYGEKERNRFIELGLRPVFHDLLDASKGFVDGASISVFDSRVRWYEQQQRLQLEQLTLFNVVSLSPVTSWHAPVSGQLDIAINRRRLNAVDEAKVLNLGAAAGYSLKWSNMLVYAFADTSIEYARKLDEHYAWYLGAETGAVMTFNQGAAMKIKWLSSESVSGQQGSKENYQWHFQYELADDQALRFEYDVKKYETIKDKNLSLSYLRYF